MGEICKPNGHQTHPEYEPKPTANAKRDTHETQSQPPLTNTPVQPTDSGNRAQEAQKEINRLLDALEVPMYFWVMAVNWSRNGNPIITTMASGTAEDLLAYSEKIGKIFTGNTLVSALPDIEYF